MNKYDKLILICAGIAVSSSLWAQENKNDSTVNRTVVVENQYNPEVMDAFKVNVLPKIEEPEVPKKQIDYATAGHSLSVFPVYKMGAITRDVEQSKRRNGYFRAAYGNRNNTDVKASYLWNITEKDCLDAMASFYGYSGTISSGYDFDPSTELPVINKDKEWKHSFFCTDASLKYSHTFSKVKLTAGGAFASQSFKYMPDLQNVSVGDETPVAQPFGKQMFNMGEGFVALSSVKEALPVEFGIEAGFRGFKMNEVSPLVGDISEKSIHTEGYLLGNLNDNQKVGVGLSMDNMIYDKPLKNYSLVKLMPNYRLSTDEIRFHAGVNLDFQTGYASGFKVSPDVRFDYTFAYSFVLYANVTGGTRLNDFRTLNSVSPYWLPMAQTKTSYTPYDASLGLKASPVDGLGLNVYGGYRETRDELFSMPFPLDGGVFNAFAQSKVRVAYAGFSIDYAYRDFFDFGIDLGYNKWNTEKGMEALLWLKPEYYINASARAKVFEGMHASLSYLYQGRVSALGNRANAVNELNLGAEYNHNDRFNVFMRLNNLLNAKYIVETGYPVQGFNVMLGVSVNF